MDTEQEITSMNISLPTTQKHYVREQSVRSGCSTPSEYMRRLIHEDQRRRAQQELEAKLLEGLNSGPDVEMTSDDWADIRREVAQRLESKKQSG